MVNLCFVPMKNLSRWSVGQNEYKDSSADL